MSLKLGTTDINKIYLGATEINKAYLGTTEIYTVSSGAPTLFDTYNNGIHGYALFKLKAAYTGWCLEIRRDSDNATVDVGFDSNGEFSLDSPVSAGGTLGTWIGSNSGFVRSWYNQAEGPNNFPLTSSLTTNQPRVVNAGVVETFNGKPAMISIDATDLLIHGSGYGTNAMFGTSGDITGFIVGEVADTTDGLIESSGTNRSMHFQLSTVTNMRFRHDNGVIGNFTVPTMAGNQQYLLGMTYDKSATQVRLWIDGTEQGSGVITDANDWGASFADNTFKWDPDIGGRQIQAILYFDEEKSDADVGNIQTDLNNYFSVY